MDAETIVYALLGLLSIIVIAALFGQLLDVIGRWAIYKKAGRPGWHALIPGLSDYTMFDAVTGMGWLGIVYFILEVMSGYTGTNVVSKTIQGEVTGASGAISSIAVLVLFALTIYMSVMLAQAFGRGPVFMICLIIFPKISKLVLGFNSDRYLGIHGLGPDPDEYGYPGGFDNTPPPPPVDEFGHTATPSGQTPPPDAEAFGHNADPFADVPPPPVPGDPFKADTSTDQAHFTGSQNTAHFADTETAGKDQGTGAAHISPQGHICPNCGAPINEGSRFCGNCGQSVV